MTRNHTPPKLLIVLRGATRETHGWRVEEFIWSHEYKAHLYKGRAFEVAEFAAAWEAADAAYRNFGEGIKPVVIACRWKNLERARAKLARERRERLEREPGGAQPCV